MNNTANAKEAEEGTDDAARPHQWEGLWLIRDLLERVQHRARTVRGSGSRSTSMAADRASSQALHHTRRLINGDWRACFPSLLLLRCMLSVSALCLSATKLVPAERLPAAYPAPMTT